MILTKSEGPLGLFLPDTGLFLSLWEPDRFDPNEFTAIENFEGRDTVLRSTVTEAEGFNNRPTANQSTFFDNQGRIKKFTGGGGSHCEVEIFIPAEWEDDSLGSRRAANQMILFDFDGNQFTFPRIEFTNEFRGDDSTGFRTFDSFNGVFVDVAAPVQFDNWNRLGVTLNPDFTVSYFVNGVSVEGGFFAGGPVIMGAAALQTFNFFNPNLTDVVATDYSVHWSTSLGQGVSDMANGITPKHMETGPSAILASARDVVPIVPGQPYPEARGLLVGTGGTATIATAAGEVRTDVPLVTGFNAIRTTNVLSLGTAVDLWAVY